MGDRDESTRLRVEAWFNSPSIACMVQLKRASEHQGSVVCLVRCDPSASWWAYSEGFKVTLIGQPLRFGKAQTAAPFPSAIWRKEP